MANAVGEITWNSISAELILILEVTTAVEEITEVLSFFLPLPIKNKIGMRNVEMISANS